MKKLILGLLVLVASGFSKGTNNYSKPGGFSVLIIDPANSNNIYAGTSNGLTIDGCSCG